jgi:homoserine O-acetyltransferase/O-succinyltransferase
MASDISANELDEGDLVRALQAIRARMLLMLGRTDLYFPVADNALEMPHLAQAELRPIPSIWGHVAGSPPPGHADFSFLRSAVRTWLE